MTLLICPFQYEKVSKKLGIKLSTHLKIEFICNINKSRKTPKNREFSTMHFVDKMIY